jgi:hypothetical protein
VRCWRPTCSTGTGRCPGILAATVSGSADDGGERRPTLDRPEAALRPGLITDLTPAERARIDGGEDLVKVLNTSRDRWREQLAADRRSDRPARELWGKNPVSLPPGGVQDFMSHLTSRVDALNTLKAAGIA